METIRIAENNKNHDSLVVVSATMYELYRVVNFLSRDLSSMREQKGR